MAVQHNHHRHPCQVCGQSFAASELTHASLVRPTIAARIARAAEAWSGDGYICRDDLNRFRNAYVETLLADEKGELSTLERDVLASMARHETLAADVDAQLLSKLTVGERLADRIADFGGSWYFIGLFLGVMCVWMLANSLLLGREGFDPYPYILLNLVLSCLAALQAPVIMMAQNRQESRDRLRSENDYRVNLKAELEIRHLHEKLDHLLRHQWERLVEIQQIQVELLNELTHGGRPRA